MKMITEPTTAVWRFFSAARRDRNPKIADWIAEQKEI